MKRVLGVAIILFFFVILTIYSSSNVFAQDSQSKPPKDEILEAVVTRVIEKKQIEIMGKKQLQQKLELLVTDGSLNGRKITLVNGNIPIANVVEYKSGDKVMVNYSKTPQGQNFFYISDYIRRGPLLWLAGIFVFLAVLVGRWKGASSIIGMAISFAVIFLYILPQISKGENPVYIAILGGAIIIPITFYLSHGFNKKTTVSIVATFISLIITGILAAIFIDLSRLTGFASEEAGFLQIAKQGAIPIKGLLLAGIIIGVLGILDDITISQSAIVYELKKTDKNLHFGMLYRKAMNVGKDHIASLINTLVLVYTGAALPLLLLFMDNPQPFGQVINNEIIAEEIVRTLIASIGLILAVPITTIIASLDASYKKK